MASRTVSFDECVGPYHLSHELLQECSKEHLLHVSMDPDWRTVALNLGLRDEDMGEVNSERTENEKGHKTLQIWKQKLGSRATYKKLIEALLGSGRTDKAEEVCKLLVSKEGEEARGEAGKTIHPENQIQQLPPSSRQGEVRRELKQELTKELKEELKKELKKELKEEMTKELKEEMSKELKDEMTKELKEEMTKELKQELMEIKEELKQTKEKLKEELERRDISTDVKNLQDQLQRLQAHMELTSLMLSWRRHSDMPFSMWNNSHSVLLQEKVYIGGGEAETDEKACTVMVYDPHSEEWNTLPKYKARSFGMAAINDQLVLVGGRNPSTGRKCKQVAVWDPESKQWVHRYPAMCIARHNLVAAAYDKWLMAAGGLGDHDYVDEVEILDTTSSQWYSTIPLPVKCDRMRSAVIQDQWYLVGGFEVDTRIRNMFSVSLSELISSGITQEYKLWNILPDAPLGRCTVVALNGSLLAVGGRSDDTAKYRSIIYHYQPESEEWVKAGDLPTARVWSACIALSNQELLVAGGLESYNNTGSKTRRVDIATVMES